ncbi:MAG: DNRLRE domain-containing protein [Ardenticatenaceae bacterium]|nr:DNRLRE domain-containing protein [Ardenticatenaceae bacterium]
MFFRKLPRIILPLLLLGLGIWLVSVSTAPAPETTSRQEAIQAFSPATDGIVEAGDLALPASQIAIPYTINLRDVPAGVLDPNNQLARWERGEIDLEEEEGILGEAKMADLRAESAELLPSEAIQEPNGPNPLTPALGTNFDSIDYNECCGGGGNVPPDPELTVGPNHIIAVVNVALEIYDKSGNSLVGPTTFDSFMSANPNCTGVFDPNAIYDESADRYILGIDADGTGYCLAVSQTADPTGSWNIYHFATASGSIFFDYPHAGVGRDAIYMGANMFTFSFLDSRIWAFDKQAMYAGQPATSVMRNLGNNEDTPQPMNLHGWNQGTWPTSGPHYFITETGYNGADHTIWAWTDPFGANTLTAVGTIDLNASTGVTAGIPLASVQSGSGTLDAGDWRPLDFEYRNGFAWTTMTVACNPGSGSVNCIRWAQINPATATVIQSGVLSSNGDYRFHPDLAVNHCDDMAVGYTKSNSSSFPSVYYAGRQGTDPLNTLQAETLIKAGEITYTSFETSSPRRWGDYTGMTIDPDGTTFWYLGEYSKNTGTSSGRWGTYIASMSYASCNPGGVPTPTPTSTGVPPTPTNTPVPPTPTNTPGPGTGSVTVNPEADAFAITSRPSGNLGGASTLRIDASPETNSYLRFNVQGVTGAVTQATLRIYTESTSASGYDVHAVADNSWGEFTLNGSNAPALGNVLNSSGAITANNYVDVDVTSYITGDGLVSFGLSTAETALIQVSSREGNNPPELVVQFGSGGPTPTPTATGTGVPPTPTNTPVPPTPTPGPGGSTFTFNVSDDAILLANRPTTNYGTASILGTDDAPDILSLLKFNVAGLDGTVASATLRVYVTSGAAAFDVAQVADNSWTEGSVTYSNAPAAGAVINNSGAVGAGWIEVDVTSYISGDGTFSLALLSEASGRNLFSSDEGANAPELVVVTGP